MKRLPLAIAAVVAALVATAVLGAGLAAGSSATSGTTVKVAKSRLGKIIVDGRGRTLYLFEKDRRGHSACSGACELHLSGVDVTLGHAGLGVAGFHLDVGHRVAGGGFVGEGCVAEVVEGPERFGDAGALECGAEVFAGEA